MTSTQEITVSRIDASIPMLGFTGPIGSGCTYISSMIPAIGQPQRKYKYYKVSDIIRGIFKSEGNPNPTVQQLQDKGNELRIQNGKHYLVAELLKIIDTEWVPGDYYGIVIDGIKNEGEVLTLRRFPNFYLFSVHADRELRSKRVISNGIFSNKDEFLNADERDEREEDEHGQQVKKCNYLSDVIVLNDTYIPKAASIKRKAYIRNIYEKYVKLIECVCDDEPTSEIFPHTDELAMTIAYALSKSSSCLKRKVGAVVVDIDKAKMGVEGTQGAQLSMPYIISTGYNEVPLGPPKCIFHPEFQKCYRDYLQEKYAAKLVHCPNCGEKIKKHVKCQKCGQEYQEFVKTCQSCSREIEIKCLCSNCGVNLFDEYLPGSKESPGKLLDMCRALHAEETALLKLSKSSGKSADNMVLYVTTQPCNLCSNKIVSAGIKKVIYAEPYSMKESKEILENGEVEIQSFQGVKSSAYFRLYR